MESTTMFLVQLFAPIFLLLGISLLVNRKFYMDAFKEVIDDAAFLMMAMVANLAVGTTILLKHNLWTTFPEVLVSLMGVGALLKGVHVALSPKGFARMGKAFMNNSFMMFAAIGCLLIGGYFAWLGYFA